MGLSFHFPRSYKRIEQSSSLLGSFLESRNGLYWLSLGLAPACLWAKTLGHDDWSICLAHFGTRKLQWSTQNTWRKNCFPRKRMCYYQNRGCPLQWGNETLIKCSSWLQDIHNSAINIYDILIAIKIYYNTVIWCYTKVMCKGLMDSDKF